MNTNLQQSSWILPVTDFSNLLALRKMKQTHVPFYNCRLQTMVLMPLTQAISFITSQSYIKFHHILRISLFLLSQWICHTYSNICFMISILTISSLSLLIAAVQIPHSYIIRLARLLLVTLTLSLTSSTPLYEMCSSKGLSIVSLNRSTRNIPMDSVEDYARQWTERLKIGRSLIQIRINKLSGSMSLRSTSIFIDPNVATHLALLHDNYVIVSADKP